LLSSTTVTVSRTTSTRGSLHSVWIEVWISAEARHSAEASTEV
jgi:hypothetical protein